VGLKRFNLGFDAGSKCKAINKMFNVNARLLIKCLMSSLLDTNFLKWAAHP